MERLCRRVRDGAGLLMLGGWESYHGLGGDYDATPLADLLPVVMSNADDRRNCSQLILVRKCEEHPITAALPFDTPPSIGGYNEFRARPSARVLLEGDRYRITFARRSTAPRAGGVFPAAGGRAREARPVRRRAQGVPGDRRCAALGRRLRGLGRYAPHGAA